MARETSPKKKSPVSKKAKGKKENLNNGKGTSSVVVHPLARDHGKGMNPRSLLTGLYGPRGERIRHVVRNGALAMPTECLQIMNVLEKKENKKLKRISREDKEVENKIENENHYELPALDSIVRPSVDANMPSVTVTYIYGKAESSSSDASAPPKFRTVAINRTIEKEEECETERIRGGGFEDLDGPSHSNTSGDLGASATSNILSSQIPTQFHDMTSDVSSQATHLMGGTSHVSRSQDSSAWTTATNVGAPKFNPSTGSMALSATGTAAPPVVSSHTAPSVAKIVPLKERPAPQWEQHIPGPNDEMQSDPQSKPPKPAWYSSNKISDLEKTLLPEWFNESAPHRTPETYIKARETIIKIADQLGNRFVSNSLVRRTIPGDAGSLYRLQSFLTNWFFINFNGMNDSAPTPSALLNRNKMIWNDKRREELVDVVVSESRKKAEAGSSPTGALNMDWDAIASKIGHGASAVDCQRQFLSMPLNESEGEQSANVAMNQPKATHRQPDINMEDMVRRLVETSSPQVIRAVTEAAVKATSSTEPDQQGESELKQVQKAGLIGLMAGDAVKKARSHEDAVAHLLAELVDQRMEKLENRMALMDDLEGILEAERVALELERRDLYTARCREWFGGN